MFEICFDLLWSLLSVSDDGILNLYSLSYWCFMLLWVPKRMMSELLLSIVDCLFAQGVMTTLSYLEHFLIALTRAMGWLKPFLKDSGATGFQHVRLWVDSMVTITAGLTILVIFSITLQICEPLNHLQGGHQPSHEVTCSSVPFFVNSWHLKNKTDRNLHATQHELR
jgi:hypothetical protein